MAKYSGKIGFVKYIEDDYSVYSEKVIEKPYTGDVLQNYRRNEPGSDQMNEHLKINNEISIVANRFAIENFSYMRYATYLGTKWQITSAKIESPRIILTLGGVYNGPKGPADAA